LSKKKIHTTESDELENKFAELCFSEENAEQIFENEKVDPYEDEDLSENELEDRDEFNKFHGNRGKPQHVIKPKAKTDITGKTSYGFNKHIRTYAINIDGRFIGGALITKPAISCDTGTISLALQPSNCQHIQLCKNQLAVNT
jgi:hypothetical protein